jgi:hypothetical protein
VGIFDDFSLDGLGGFLGSVQGVADQISDISGIVQSVQGGFASGSTNQGASIAVGINPQTAPFDISSFLGSGGAGLFGDAPTEPVAEIQAGPLQAIQSNPWMFGIGALLAVGLVVLIVKR